MNLREKMIYPLSSWNNFVYHMIARTLMKPKTCMKRNVLSAALLTVGAIILPPLFGQTNTNAPVPATPVTSGTNTAVTPVTSATNATAVTPVTSSTNASAVKEVASPAPATAVTPVSNPQTFQNSTAVQDIPNPSFFDNLWNGGAPLHFGLTAGETYDDNILISPQKLDDFITHVTPDLDYELGEKGASDSNYLNVYFAPTLFFYNNHTRYNRQDYNADLFYQYTWTRLTFSLEQQYQHLTDASIDIGNLVTRDVYTTKLGMNYAYNDNLGIFGTATQQINNYQQGSNVNINQWTVDASALYQIASKLWLGAGPRVEFIDISGAPNEQEDDFLAHLNYNPGEKISATFAGGVEYLSYQDNTPSHILPIFELTGFYRPFDGTQLSLSASRESTNSYALDGETVTNATVQLSARQRFYRDFYFTLSGGYTNANYEFGSLQTPSRVNGGPRRMDNYYFVNGGVEWDARTWLKVSGSYQYSEDDSNIAQNSFNDNQVNVQASVNF
jgi:hypothetical protein